MRHLLLVAFAFPPATDVGAVRPGALAKYLPRFGWEPIVLSPRLPAGNRLPVTMIETSYRDVLGDFKAKLRLDPRLGLHQRLNLPQPPNCGTTLSHAKVLDWLRNLFSYPDPTRGWIPFALEQIKQLAVHTQVDTIVTTSPPISGHLIGVEARRILGVPWIADLRDPWQGADNPWIISRFQRRLEQRTLSQADALVTVSEAWAEDLRRRYPGQRVSAILNGFDAEGSSQTATPLTTKFSITYTGTLYQGRRDPSLLFEVLQELIVTGTINARDVCVRFYGPPEPWLPELAKKYRLEGIVETHGMVARPASLRHQQESQLLLLLGLENADFYAGGYPAKIFEYLAARRPILAIGGSPGAVRDLLIRTRTGCHALSRSQLRSVLAEAYREFTMRGTVPYEGSPAEILKHTHHEMARKFAHLLSTVADGGSLTPEWESASRVSELFL